jgi:hypothetical protein
LDWIDGGLASKRDYGNRTLPIFNALGVGLGWYLIGAWHASAFASVRFVLGPMVSRFSRKLHLSKVIFWKESVRASVLAIFPRLLEGDHFGKIVEKIIKKSGKNVHFF